MQNFKNEVYSAIISDNMHVRRARPMDVAPFVGPEQLLQAKVKELMFSAEEPGRLISCIGEQTLARKNN